MIFPDIINYLLTLRYPGSETGTQNWVCYRGAAQVIIPLIPPNGRVDFTIRPLHGVYAQLMYATRVGTDMVPNSFSASVSQYGGSPWSGVITQRGRDDPIEYFVLVTEQEPSYTSVSNISPLAQRCEVAADFIVIPSPQDLVTITDALRRLHTSTESERLLQQAAYLLGVFSGQPQEPRPPIGGS